VVRTDRGSRSKPSLILLLVAGCAQAPAVVKTSSAPHPPGWILRPPQDGEILSFTGAREGAGSLEEGTDAAMEAARAHAAEFIGVNVSSEHRDVMSTDLGSDAAQDTVKSRATALIRNARIADVYYEKYSRKAGATAIDRFDVWVLIRLSRAELAAERVRQEEELKTTASAALSQLREGGARERAGDLLGALVRYREAATQLQSLPRQIELGDAQLRTAGQALQSAQEALATVRAKVRRALLVGPDWIAGPVAVALSAKGFTAVTQPEGSERQALDSARAQGVPWVIVVAGNTAPGGRVFSQVAATASLDVRALEAQSGAVAAAQMKQSKGFGRTAEAARDAAAQQAARAAGAELADALISKENAGL
jgi:hypothetical protein